MSIANWLPGFFHLNCQLLLHWHWHSLATLTSSRWRCLIASDSFKEPLKGLPILYTLTRSPSLSLVCVCLANWPLHKYLPAHMFLATLRKLCQQQDSRFLELVGVVGWAGHTAIRFPVPVPILLDFWLHLLTENNSILNFCLLRARVTPTHKTLTYVVFFSGIYRFLFFWGIFCTFCAYNRYQRG